MPDKKVTIYDVAAEAGVAISTVSRVLNESKEVSEGTRKRVMETIDRLQFRPALTAKTLAQGARATLAVAIPTFTTPFHTELLKGVRTQLVGTEVDLLLYDLGSKTPERELHTFLKRGAVAGILVAGIPMSQRVMNELRAARAAVVLIGLRHEGFDSMYWDDSAGARSAVEHLLECGHTRIGMIRSKSEHDLQQGRVKGYREALEAAGIAFDPALVAHGHTPKHAGFSEEAGEEAMQDLLALDDRPTAVFASSDVQAIGAAKVVRDAGLRIPEDVAIVGYDDVKFSKYIGLSSVAQQMHYVGEKSTELLLGRMERTRDYDEVHEEQVETQLCVRRSSDYQRP